ASRAAGARWSLSPVVREAIRGGARSFHQPGRGLHSRRAVAAHRGEGAGQREVRHLDRGATVRPGTRNPIGLDVRVETSNSEGWHFGWGPPHQPGRRGFYFAV